MSELEPKGTSTNSVRIIAIVVAGIVILACIIAFTAIAIAFFVNAPWIGPF